MDAKQLWEEANTLLMPQYGTSMHYPYCNQHGCTGCVPVIPPKQTLDLSIFRKDA